MAMSCARWRGAQPAHAVRQPRRRESHLRVAEALADLAEHLVAGTRRSSSRTTRMAAGIERSMVSSTRSIAMPGVFMSVRNIVAAVAGAAP